MDTISELLERMQRGDEQAREQLFAAAYEELHRQAHNQLRGGGRNTLLDTSVLVHECFLRFSNAGQLKDVDRGHFFAYVARVMRSVIVDFARRRQSARRGGEVARVPMTLQLAESLAIDDLQVVQIDEAINALQEHDERLVRVVEMRYFAGMEVPEIAAALGVTDRTVRRDWEKARLLLAAFMGA